MMKTFFGSVASLFLLLAACSVETTSPGTSSTSSSGSTSSTSSSGSTSSTSSSGGSSSGSTSSSSGSAEPVTTSLVGTINGKNFSFSSAMAKVEGEDLDLVFSNKGDICTVSKQGKFRGGEVFVQIYGLKGTGEVTSSDMKFAEVGDCTSGSPIGENDVAAASRATATSKINIITRDATKVAGTIDLTFEDGSVLKGDFNVALCDGSLGEDPVCF